MRPRFEEATSELLGLVPGMTSAILAAKAVTELDRLVRRVGRLVGEMGVRTVIMRSIRLASAAFPWLTTDNESNVESPYALLRADIELQTVENGAAGFALVLSTFVDIFERLIGPGLMSQLLEEVWPAVFPSQPKEST